MATKPASTDLPAAGKPRRSTRGFTSTPRRTVKRALDRSSPLPACISPRSVELAGRSVAISCDVPVLFDAPLAPHHKLIGRWVALQQGLSRHFTRPQARQHIERVFDAAVHEILDSVELADLRIAVLHGEECGPPAIAIICESLGQLDLGWIETSDAPIPWRASAYRLLEQTLILALPVFDYAYLIDEMAMYYWDGETDDEGARQALIYYHGADDEEIDDSMLPSAIDARRPAWMIGTNGARPRALPPLLRKALNRVRTAHKALRSFDPERRAWQLDRDILYEYVPGIEECSISLPLTLVPMEQFARELDDIGRHGMEMGFMDFAGICPLPDATCIDDWFASLRLGAQFLAAVQDLILLDPDSL
ncbi:hypothetical protein [Sphingobium cupriresistens]|uniref:hypothetical protein n=1 Tax=Sphingobium cupriresistens TaxID=1132417 RepID=UPI0013EE1965|nr:hypothetical protein [Sphingobium cupriresistens]